MTITYYKITASDGSPIHGGVGTWYLPRGRRPGRWMPRVEVDPCYSGYHLCDAVDLVEWIEHGVVWVAEGRGEMMRHGNKTAFSQARLVRRVGEVDDRVLRLFAADCATRVLGIFEARRPGDDRPRKAIIAVRQYARGEIDWVALAAARFAAWDAVWATAWDVARPAAWAAAEAAARDAAWDAALAAARDAALAAARFAAWDAVRDARDAAWVAGRRAERATQGRILLEWISGKRKRGTPLPTRFGRQRDGRHD